MQRPLARILWRSLLNAPPLSEVLGDWLRVLSNQQVVELPPSLDQQFALLLGYLRRQRCLLVLDNVESIMSIGERAGQYRSGYEDYGQLLQRIAEYDHQSCLLLTSREEPYTLKRLEIGASAVRSLRLGGLAVQVGQALLRDIGVTGSIEASSEVVHRYSGNPLALKLVAATITELFAGDIAQFLSQEALVFDDIRDVLDQHFARLSPLEREVMNWLAIEREPLPFAALYDDLVQSPSRRVVLEALRSLHRRSLLERNGERLSLQNVVLEYTTDHLVEHIRHELADFGVGDSESKIQNPQSKITDSRLNRFALVKAQAKEYVRESQVRMLLQPVANFLSGHWGKEVVAKRLQDILHRLRAEAPLAPGYAAANILHLLLQLQVDLRGYNFSRLAVWQADLRESRLPQVNFSQADLTHSTFIEPFETIRALAFSPNGLRLVGGAYNGNLHVWRLVDHQPEWLLQGHRGVVYSVAWSPDGRLLASASADQTARLWDLATGELCCILRGHGSDVVLVAFDATGELLISMGQDGVTRTWEVRTLLNNTVCDQPYTFLGGTPMPMYQAAASRDGAWVAAGGDDRIVRCWDVRDGHLRASLQGHTHAVTRLAFSPDGKTLASSSLDRTIRLWMLADQAQTADLYQPGHILPEQAEQLAFSPDGAVLASGYFKQINLWEMGEPTGRGKLRQRLTGHSGRLSALAFSPDGATLASASYDQTVQLWNVQIGQAEHKLYGQARAVELVRFSPDGATLVSTHFDHTVHLWTQDGRHLHALHGHQDVVRHVAFSPPLAGARPLLATGGSETIVRIWDMHSGENRFSLRRHAISVNSLVFRPSEEKNGFTLVSGGADAMVYRWDAATGEPFDALAGHSSQIKWITFNPAGALLATGSGDQTTRIWEMPSGRLRHVLQEHTGMVRYVAFHPNGRLLATASDDTTVCLWDAVEGRVCQTLQGHTHAVINTQFTLDGKTLISVSDDQTVRVWSVDAATGMYQPAHVLPASVYKHNCVALSPDSITLVSGGMDGVVRLWDLQTGQVRHTLHGHTNLITGVDVSPDGRQILSGCSNGMVKLWDAQSGQCLHTLQPEGPYVGMNITGVTGISETQKAALVALGAVTDGE
ncbi:MAG: hypothetical protein DCC55_25315 [Chloroflexi bacterium]|nr:MAG: hypothetical protein DCC55_25315 [Chloroflexota bacterium]